VKWDEAFGARLLDIKYRYADGIDTNRAEVDEAYQQGGIVKLA